MRSAARLGLLWIGLSLWAAVLPGYPQGTHAVQSLPAAQVDALIRQPGHCLVAVMAAWCHPCIEELPDLNALARRYQPQGLRTLGLSVDYAGPQAMQPFIDEFKIAFPVYWIGEAGLETYDINRIPLLIFVHDGRIVKRIQGRRSPAEIEKEIAAFLGAP